MPCHSYISEPFQFCWHSVLRWNLHIVLYRKAPGVLQFLVAWHSVWVKAICYVKVLLFHIFPHAAQLCSAL